jgi:hypothetical protein
MYSGRVREPMLMMSTLAMSEVATASRDVAKTGGKGGVSCTKSRLLSFVIRAN